MGESLICDIACLFPLSVNTAKGQEVGNNPVKHEILGLSRSCQQWSH